VGGYSHRGELGSEPFEQASSEAPEWSRAWRRSKSEAAMASRSRVSSGGAPFIGEPLSARCTSDWSTRPSASAACVRTAAAAPALSAAWTSPPTALREPKSRTVNRRKKRAAGISPLPEALAPACRPVLQYFLACPSCTDEWVHLIRGRIVPELNDSGYREVFVQSVRVIYKVEAHTVVVLAVIHGRRLLESALLRFD